MKYDFQTQLEDGAEGEALLDQHFAQWFEITPATMDEQKRGIDRWWVDKETGQRVGVEYKTDRIAKKTGNAFVEIISMDKLNKAGWAYSSRADWLAYYVAGDEVVYLIEMPRLRQEVYGWTKKYRRKEVMNSNYKTVGLLVPLRVFECIASQVISL